MTQAEPLSENHQRNNLVLIRPMGIDTHQEPVIYLPSHCPVCRSEGFSALSRVVIEQGDKRIVASVNIVAETLLPAGHAGLSDAAWRRLGRAEGTAVRLHHAGTPDSLNAVKEKLYGRRFEADDMSRIITDISAGDYSDIQLAAFVSACAGRRLERAEMLALTQAMVACGNRLSWRQAPVMDKHCVGGLPGNRTTPILVAIGAAAGLCIPKTSSRAISSPAGTADTMATLAPVALSLSQMRQVVDQEGGCIAWGGSISLSPADETLLGVSRALELASEGQMVASVLSKKVAAGATHVLVDLPVGATAKVCTLDAARRLAADLQAVGEAMGLVVRCQFSNGEQPVGRGIGPALEARDLLQVLQGDPQAPADLRERALTLAGELLEMGNRAQPGRGLDRARDILDSGAAWHKFKAICEAQGGMREPGRAAYRQTIGAPGSGQVTRIDNRVLGKLAKLAGAPDAPAAGLDLHVTLGTQVVSAQPLFTLHAESRGELSYALDYFAANPGVIAITPSVEEA